MNKNQKNLIDSVQHLRAVSVIAVVLYHFDRDRFPNGYLGVDLFFVVSGFVITPLLMEIFSAPKTHLKSKLYKFFMRRFFRLAPAASTTIVATVLLLLFFGVIWDHPRSASQAIWALLVIGNLGAYRFSAGTYFDPNPNPLVHFWSLSAEVQLYIVIPLFLLILKLIVVRLRFGIIFILIIIASVFAQAFFFPIFFEFIGFRNVDGMIFYSPFSQIYKFAFGALAFIYLRKFEHFRLPLNLRLSLVLWPTILILLLSPFRSSTLQMAIIVLTGSLLLLHSSKTQTKVEMRERERERESLGWFRATNKYLKIIGDKSYSIYLVHWPIIYIFSYSPYTKGINKFALVSLTLIAVIGASFLLNKYIEEKFRLTRGKNYNQKFQAKDFTVFFLIPLLLSTFAFILATKTSGTFVAEQIPIRAIDDKSCDRLNSGNACFYPADDSAKTVFLFGDSVGMSLANSLLDYGKDNNYSVITMGLAGCSYLDQQIISKYRNSKLLEKLNVRAGNSKITCSEFNQRTIDLVRTKKPDLVISSTHSIDSEAIEYFGMSYNDLLDIKVQSLAKLREVAPNLIVVGAPPLLGPEEFTPRPTVFQLHVGRKVIPLIDLERYYLQDDSGMQSKLNNLKIPYLSLLKNFCDNSKCDLFSGGDWIYADGSHLSIHGASKVKFSEILATVTR